VILFGDLGTAQGTVIQWRAMPESAMRALGEPLRRREAPLLVADVATRPGPDSRRSPRGGASRSRRLPVRGRSRVLGASPSSSRAIARRRRRRRACSPPTPTSSPWLSTTPRSSRKRRTRRRSSSRCSPPPPTASRGRSHRTRGRLQSPGGRAPGYRGRRSGGPSLPAPRGDAGIHRGLGSAGGARPRGAWPARRLPRFRG
jgi:hypothetical protein